MTFHAIITRFHSPRAKDAYMVAESRGGKSKVPYFSEHTNLENHVRAARENLKRFWGEFEVMLVSAELPEPLSGMVHTIIHDTTLLDLPTKAKPAKAAKSAKPVKPETLLSSVTLAKVDRQGYLSDQPDEGRYVGRNVVPLYRCVERATGKRHYVWARSRKEATAIAEKSL